MDSDLIIALVEGRGLAKGEIGLACFNLSSPILTLYQFSDSQTYGKIITKINALDPAEILLPNTLFASSSNNRLYKLISNNFPDIITVKISRKYFNENKGLEYIKQLCILDYSKCIIEVTSKYYCLAACAALIKYMECAKNIVLASLSIPIIFEGAEKTAIIDPITSKLLELISNKKIKKKHNCLYSVMNHTKTNSGMKLLRSNILQPSTDLDTIKCRLDTVEELVKQENILYSLRTLLQEFTDLEYLFALLVQIQQMQQVQESVKSIESKILNILRLKHALQLMKSFMDLLKDCRSKILITFLKALSDNRFEIMKEDIDKIIEEEANYERGVLNIRIHKCFAIKRGISGLLDITRRTFVETVNDINDYVKWLAAEKKLPITQTYSVSRGYYLQFSTRHSKMQQADLPREFTKITKSKNFICFTTDEMINFNDKITELTTNICLISNRILNNLLQTLRKNFGCIYKLIECVSLIDMLQSFAYVAITSDYVRPEFGEVLALKSAYHPIFRNMKGFHAVANDVYATRESSFILITGPNMSGKSSYLQQVAMLHVMAQCGSFVPALRAHFRITNQIFTRMATDDDIETNTSLFEQEMIEMKYIVENFTSSSLILIDELCRSTNKEEGTALSIALIEWLCTKTAYVFFATHLNELCTLETMLPNVLNQCFNTELKMIGNREKIEHTHILQKGICSVENYGIKMTEMASISSAFIEDAKSLLLYKSTQTSTFQLKKSNYKRRCVFKLFNILYRTSKFTMTDTELIAHLKDLKNSFEDEYRQLMD